MTKILTQPLVFLLILQFFVLLICWKRLASRKSIAGPLALLSLTILLLGALSIPAVGTLLQESVTLLPTAEAAEPEYIVVLAGGLQEGTSPDLDVLTTDSMKRVLFGVRYWKMHPSARIVITGANRGRNQGRVTELMAESAQCHGVPAASIIRETNSFDTSQHPVRLRATPGFTPETRLAIVTSAWHERRAVTEFRRYFRFADPQAVPTAEAPRPLDWFPDNRGLLRSTAAIQEWAGIAWYRIRAMRR
jgi:uncharacterized SAM-binding protein YcdF (DUF218 family)